MTYRYLRNLRDSKAQKISNMSDKTAGTITMTGVGAAVVGGGELLKRKKRKNPRLRKSKP